LRYKFPRRDHIDSGGLQSPAVFHPALWIDHMEGPATALELVLDERKHHPALLLGTMKEGT
jgi:hypothetical protein